MTVMETRGYDGDINRGGMTVMETGGMTVMETGGMTVI